jgi:arylsulfatase A-like enzyme
LEPIEWDLDDHQALTEISEVWFSLDAEEQALIQAHLAARYGTLVQYADDHVALLWQELEARGALDNTLVMVWSDHGEQLFEHDKPEHGATLHAEENDALAFFWSPYLQPGQHKGPTTHVDLVPNVLSAMGVAIPDHVTGQLVGERTKTDIRTSISVEISGSPVQAIQQGDYRLHYSWDGESALFNRALDPADAHDLQPIRPQVNQAMWDLLLPVVESYQAILPDFTPVDPGP